MSTSTAYPLRRDGSEHRRLAAQAAFWAADAAALFDAAGVIEGQRVADLGCGTAHVATALARRVGRTGTVFALDNDAVLLDAIAAGQRPPNVVAVQGNAFATKWADSSLDAVHARFVAAPCGRVDALLDEMLRLVRPGGVVMLQEPLADTWRVPACPAWRRVRALIRAGFAARGGDFDAGRDLRRRLDGVLADVRERRVVHMIPATHSYAALPLAFCDALRSTWCDAGLIDDHAVEELHDQVSRALAMPRATITTFTLVQVWGRKRTRSPASPAPSTVRALPGTTRP